MNRWTLAILLVLALPAFAQDGLSKAGIPFSPTQPFSYNTVQHGPAGGYDYNTSYYGYGHSGSNYYYGGYGYGNRAYGSHTPGGYHNAFGGGRKYEPARSGRRFPSAAQESRLHEIRR